jgi:hypothetical protein
MTVHFISVGVSLLDSLDAARQRTSLQPELIAAIRDRKPQSLLADQGIGSGDAASTWLTNGTAPAGSAFRDEDVAALISGVCAAVRPDLWPSALSAELDTFARASGPGHLLRSADIALLISSDTVTGLTAGLWNAAALTRADLGRISYLPKPGEPPGSARGHAVLVRIPGLDVGDNAGFSEAMEGLGRLGRNLLDADDVSAAEPFRFYLSGGFKAAIPYLIGLAEGLRSIGPGRDVSAWVLHDTTRSAAIRLPLRSFIAGTVQGQLGCFAADGTRPDKPGGPAVLEGYAYEQDPGGKKWRLTPFGKGLRSLYGLDSEGLRR